MFAYARAAIDFWPGWMTEDQFKTQMKDEPDGTTDIIRYFEFFEEAKSLAKQVGWEGDMREGPYVAGLPTDTIANDFHVMIAWKQDNNGDTFVVSPFKLPWLEQGDNGNWVEG